MYSFIFQLQRQWLHRYCCHEVMLLIIMITLLACNCYSPGVVDNTICDSVNGICLCKANVDTEVNSICDTCLDGYWNISSENINGCQGLLHLYLFICHVYVYLFIPYCG